MASCRLVSEARSVQELRRGFDDNIDTLDVCVGLLGLGGEEPLQHVLELRQQLAHIRDQVAQLRSQIHTSRQELQEAALLVPQLTSLNSRLQHMRDNLPARLPLTQHQQQQQQQQRPKPDLAVAGAGATADDHQQDVPSSAAKPSSVPQFQYITIAEFDEVPKYIRGRLQYTAVNKVVDDLNTALTAKYALLRRPRAKLALPDMKLVNALRGQASAATKGRVFVVAEDLKRWSNVKVDTATRSVLTVLRTCKKCSEIRGPASLIRYAVPQLH